METKYCNLFILSWKREWSVSQYVDLCMSLFQCITYNSEITKVQEVFAVPEGTLIKSHVIMFPTDSTQS